MNKNHKGLGEVLDVGRRTAARSLRRINLNQLKVLAELCLVHSVTQAAENLGLTQSAISHVLAQLRGHFGDELFVRTGNGMTPTPLALKIAERLPGAFVALENAIAPELFDPLQSSARFFIACSDYAMAVLLPRLLARLEIEAPRVQLTILPLDGRTIDRIDKGVLDLVIAGIHTVPERLMFERLFYEKAIWVHRVGHPLSARPFSDWDATKIQSVTVDYGIGASGEELESFASQSMIQWTRTPPGPAPLSSDIAAASNSKIVVPNFFAAAVLAAGSDYLTQLPRGLALSLAARFDLVTRNDWPTTKGGYLAQMWRPALTDRYGHPWLRGMVQSCADALTDDDGSN